MEKQKSVRHVTRFNEIERSYCRGCSNAYELNNGGDPPPPKFPNDRALFDAVFNGDPAIDYLEAQAALSDSYLLGSLSEFSVEAATYGSADFSVRYWLRDNVAELSSLRTITKYTALVEVIAEADSYADFIVSAHSISDNFNDAWLRTEWNTARTAANGARRFTRQVFDGDTSLYPYLRYQTAEDSRVRPQHQRLNGRVARKDSAFWASYYPPNGYNCRCLAYETDTMEGAQNEYSISPQEVPMEFRNNPAFTGSVFSPAHPYYAEETAASKAIKDRVLDRWTKDQVRKGKLSLVNKKAFLRKNANVVLQAGSGLAFATYILLANFDAWLASGDGVMSGDTFIGSMIKGSYFVKGEVKDGKVLQFDILFQKKVV